MSELTIGEISKLVGLPAKTIRFYEDQGVVSHISRGENGYRIYSGSALEELKLLKYARDLGLPLAEIKKLIKGCEGGNCHHSKEYVEASVNNYLSMLTAKITQMNLLKSKLELLKKSLQTNQQCNTNTPYCCDILHQLLTVSHVKGGDSHG